MVVEVLVGRILAPRAGAREGAGDMGEISIRMGKAFIDIIV